MITADKEYKNIKNKRYKRAREKSDVDYDKLAEDLKG